MSVRRDYVTKDCNKDCVRGDCDIKGDNRGSLNTKGDHKDQGDHKGRPYNTTTYANRKDHKGLNNNCC